MTEAPATRQTSVAARSGGRARLRVGRAMTYLILSLWTFIALFPVAWIYMQSFKTPEETYAIPPKFVFMPTLHNYEVVLGLIVPKEFEGMSEGEARTLESRFPRHFLNSAIVSVGTIAGGLVLAILAAYPLARMRMRGRGTYLSAIVATRMVPPPVLVIPLYVMWRALGLADTHLGLMLVYLATILPFSIWLLHGFLVDIPLALEEAAMVDGCSRLGACFRVILPLAAPGLAATAIFNLIFVWNEFLLASMLTAENAKTVTPGIINFITEKAILWGRLYAASALMLLPVVVFSLLVQKHIARGLTAGAVKGA